MNSAAFCVTGRIEFIQSKMLLPTYDVFDEMRNFAPAKSQQLFDLAGKQMALTICEDAWNDKRFWDRRLYGIDPVEGTTLRRRQLRAQHFCLPVLVGKARIPSRHARRHRQNQKVLVAMV